MSENAPIIEAWNTVLFDKFCRYKHLLLEGLGQHGTKIFEEYPPETGEAIVDIGCGFGDSTARLAEMIGEEGSVTGIDCAPRFIKSAQEEFLLNDNEALTYRIADVQCDDLGGPYDRGYSRFGTMFFSSPVAALRNVRRCLKPGATFHMSVWRKRQDNPCFFIAQQTVEAFIEAEDLAENQVTCGPGPFSMASPDLVSDQLIAAGFEGISFQRYDAPMCMGHSIDEALRFAKDLGPAGELIRLGASKADKSAEAIDNALREAFSPLLTEDGIWATSSTWLISARVPS